MSSNNGNSLLLLLSLGSNSAINVRGSVFSVLYIFLFRETKDVAFRAMGHYEGIKLYTS